MQPDCVASVKIAEIFDAPRLKLRVLTKFELYHVHVLIFSYADGYVLTWFHFECVRVAVECQVFLRAHN